MNLRQHRQRLRAIKGGQHGVVSISSTVCNTGARGVCRADAQTIAQKIAAATHAAAQELQLTIRSIEFEDRRN